MPRNNNRGGRNNNPSGRNQYSNGVMDIARERPLTAAAAAAAAVGAGVFLWSRRNQISDQISNLSDQIGEWAENLNIGGQGSWAGDDTAGLTTTGISGSSGSRSTSGTSSRGRSTSGTGGMSETGGGNASIGAHSGGGGSTGTASGRGRAQSTPTTQQ